MSENQYTPAPSAPSGYGAGTPRSTTAVDPGRTLSIIGLILAFVAPLIGLILSIVAFRQSKQAGLRNTLAIAGIAIAAVLMVVYLIIGIVMAIAGVLTASVSYGY